MKVPPLPFPPHPSHPSHPPHPPRPAHRRTLLAGAAAALALGCATPVPVGRTTREVVDETAGPPPTPAVTQYVARGTPRPRADHLALPLRLAIPKIGVDAPVLSVGLTPTRAMDVPQRAEDVGWYEYSPRPGTKGNSVLAGHLDWNGVPGVFRRLAEVHAGDAVLIRAADGEERAYTVEWNREWPVDAAPIGEVFQALDVPGLTLITCGGRFNPVTRSYDTRVVVRALR